MTVSFCSLSIQKSEKKWKTRVMRPIKNNASLTKEIKKNNS